MGSYIVTVKKLQSGLMDWRARKLVTVELRVKASNRAEWKFRVTALEEAE